MIFFSPAAPPAQPPPALVYAARFYDSRPKVKTYSHLYLWRMGEKGRGKILTTGNDDDSEPQAAPDGRTVYFLRARDKQKPAVCAVDVQTGRVRILFIGAAKGDLKDLRVSANGKKVLVKQTFYGYKSGAHNYKQWFVVLSGSQSSAPRLLWRGAADEDADTSWTATDTQILLLHPPRYQWNDKTFEENLVSAGSTESISLAAPNKPSRRLTVTLDGNSLTNDVSPDRRFIIRQSDAEDNLTSSRFLPALFIRTADGEIASVLPIETDETLHWLSDTRLVGIERDKNWTPVRLHFYTMPPKANEPSPAIAIDLHLETNAAIVAALKEQGDTDFQNVYQVDTVPSRSDGFLLGTPWHRGDKGVRVWINAETGNATLWSKCGPPHPSPNGAYFWEQPGSDFAVIGKRTNGASITEPVLGLNVASYVNPAKLISVVSGAAWTNGADWLPAAKPKGKPKP